jgi:hypothetical protein
LRTDRITNGHITKASQVTNTLFNHFLILCRPTTLPIYTSFLYLFISICNTNKLVDIFIHTFCSFSSYCWLGSILMAVLSQVSTIYLPILPLPITCAPSLTPPRN